MMRKAVKRQPSHRHVKCNSLQRSNKVLKREVTIDHNILTFRFYDAGVGMQI